MRGDFLFNSILPIHNLIITHPTHLYCCLFFCAAAAVPSLTPGSLETEPGFVHLCAKLLAVPSVKCVPKMGKGCETDRESHAM